MRAFSEGVAPRAWSKLRPMRNRGFRSRLRHDPYAPAVLLPPHLDDVVIDCWSVLTGAGEVRVVNVFTAPALAGRRPMSLGFVAHAHRGARAEPSYARVDAALAAHVGAASLLDAPAALGAPLYGRTRWRAC